MKGCWLGQRLMMKRPNVDKSCQYELATATSIALFLGSSLHGEVFLVQIVYCFSLSFAFGCLEGCGAFCLFGNHPSCPHHCCWHLFELLLCYHLVY